MEVYIANGTLQHRQFHYRIPQARSPRVVEIAAGGQAKLPEDFPQGSQLTGIIAQLERAGAIPEDDPRAITKPAALIYRVQKRIEADAINEAFEADQDARQDRSSDMIERAGMASFTAAQKAGAVKETTFEVIETTDVQKVTGGVNMEVTVSDKPGKAGRLERTARR